MGKIFFLFFKNIKNLLESRKMFKVRKLKIDYDDLFFLWTKSNVENNEKFAQFSIFFYFFYIYVKINIIKKIKNTRKRFMNWLINLNRYKYRGRTIFAKPILVIGKIML